MEMVGSSEESGKHKEVCDLESLKSWITRRAFEFQLKAKSESPIWFKANQSSRSSEEIDQMDKLSNITGIDTLQTDGGFHIHTKEEKVPMIDEKAEAPDMDFVLSPYSDLIYHLHDQMQKLVEPSFFSTEAKDVARLWSGSEEILRSISKLQSISAQIDELCRLIPDLNKKLRLISYSKSSENSSAAAEIEEKQFTGYRHMWELFNGNKFEDLTSLSSMIFMHCAPGRMPWYAVVKPTLQILSIKVTELTELEWPLKVYGIVAARDTVDNLRNPLFLCSRNGGQLVTQQDPFLRLTGPSRAVVCEEPVSFEIQLKLKGRTESEDKALMSSKLSYKGDSANRYSILNVGNHFCKMEFCFQQLERSVQATIVGVRVVSQGPSSSFPHGAQVFCSSLPRGFKDDDTTMSCPDLLLHDWKDGIRSIDGHLDLARHVVSAELGGKLKVLIKDCKSSDLTGYVLFTPKKCNFSQATCLVGDAEVEITVAWSLLVKDDECILSSSYVDPFEACPMLHPSTLTSLKTGVAEN
ncbi:hypothetical protein ACQ4PT_018259 [Festuca glaucescens]